MLTIQCKTKTSSANRHGFSIEIEHFAGAMGLTLYYIANGKYVQVDMNCDLENCERKTLYKRELSAKESDDLFKKLQALKLDTLKKSYRPDGMVLDGLVSSIKVHGPDLANSEISIDNVNLPTTDSLYQIIDKFVLTKKYQFHHFGQE